MDGDYFRAGDVASEGSQKSNPGWDRPAGPKPGALALHFGFDAALPSKVHTIVRGLLHRGSLTLIYGLPKTGKSFLATDLSLALADGRGDWMGHRIAQPGPVLYVACEGHAGFWKRLTAAASHYGWTERTFPRNLITAIGRPTLIKTDNGGRTFGPNPVSILDAMQRATVAGLAPVAVIVDTVFRSFGGGNVNASDHMNAYVAALSEIADHGVAVAAVHHETKGGATPAGSISLVGGADTIVRVWRGEGGKRFWQVEAAKDDAETAPRGFQLEVVDIGLDPEGYSASSCVVLDAGPSESAKGRKRRKDDDELVWRALRDLLADAKSITRDLLRNELRSRGFFQTEGDGALGANDRSRLQRALNSFVRKGEIVMCDGAITMGTAGEP